MGFTSRNKDGRIQAMRYKLLPFKDLSGSPVKGFMISILVEK
jgi:hypothetical protein